MAAMGASCAIPAEERVLLFTIESLKQTNTLFLVGTARRYADASSETKSDDKQGELGVELGEQEQRACGLLHRAQLLDGTALLRLPWCARSSSADDAAAAPSAAAEAYG